MALEKSVFDWKTKKHAVDSKPHRNNQDIQISISRGNNQRVVCIGFRHNMAKLISDTGYIVTAVKKNRMYFASSDAHDGFKCCQNKDTKTENSYMRFTVSEYEIQEIYQKFVGFYDLKFDDFNEYYYIELTEEENNGR